MGAARKGREKVDIVEPRRPDTRSLPQWIQSYEKLPSKHRIKDLARITYRRPHAWVLSKARRYKKPFVYSHPQGAIKWVKL